MGVMVVVDREEGVKRMQAGVRMALEERGSTLDRSRTVSPTSTTSPMKMCTAITTAAEPQAHSFMVLDVTTSSQRESVRSAVLFSLTRFTPRPGCAAVP